MKTNFMEKIITNLYMKVIRKKQAKMQKKKLTEQEKQKAVIYKQLKELYSFVSWLNTKGLKTRRHRKAFWRAVKEGQPVIEDTLNNLIKRYAPKPKEKKPKEGQGEKPITPKPKLTEGSTKSNVKLQKPSKPPIKPPIGRFVKGGELKEGTMNKGGLNSKPSTQRPEAPKGQKPSN